MPDSFELKQVADQRYHEVSRRLTTIGDRLESMDRRAQKFEVNMAHTLAKLTERLELNGDSDKAHRQKTIGAGAAGGGIIAGLLELIRNIST